MPSARPRLVEEGTPIYAAAPNDDHTMFEVTSNGGANNPMTEASKTGPGSSLAKASSGVPQARRRNSDSTTTRNGINVQDASQRKKYMRSSSLGSDHSSQRKGGFPPSRSGSFGSQKSDSKKQFSRNHNDKKSAPGSAGHYIVGGAGAAPPPSPSKKGGNGKSYYNERRPSGSYRTKLKSPTYVVGGQEEAPATPVERMEGVEDLSTKSPMVVIDGANVAYAYSDAIAGLDGSEYGDRGSREPDARGIKVATRFFTSKGLRVLAVLPATWFRAKPREGDQNQANAMMLTPQMEVLSDLKAKGLLVASPPRDDDDAYALTIARREHDRAAERNGEGPGYVLSNDMFRDAMNRDESGKLREWLTSSEKEAGPGRISYTFCDMGTIDTHGDRELDFIPNPRHPLVVWMEKQKQ